jgi:acetoin:2,6-dichlorophenolindophenol oxidoreductase subunit beta
MTRISMIEAIASAVQEEMRRDDRVFLMGEDVRYGIYGGKGLVEEFGEERVRNTPISESGFLGAGVGAAITGMRPVVDMTISVFLYSAMDPLISQAAKNRYMFGGQASLPIVIRSSLFYGAGQAAHHSDRPYPLFMNTPGLKIIVPSTSYDAKGLLKSAIRTDDPVLSFEDVTLWGTRSEVPDEEYVIPLGVADIKRAGTDVTIVAIAGSVPHALAAAKNLAEEQISVEVIDPRSLVPLDYDTILSSVARTGRLVVADPAHRTCGAAGEIAATVTEELFWDLQAPVVRVTTPDVQIPFSPALERQLFPTTEKITSAVRKVLEPHAPRSTGSNSDSQGEATLSAVSDSAQG